MTPSIRTTAAAVAAALLVLAVQTAGAFESKHAARGVACQACHKTQTPSRAAKASACNGCHSYDALAKQTAQIQPNPHDSHAGQIRCTLCHKEHKASENYCRSCHATGEKFGFKVP